MNYSEYLKNSSEKFSNIVCLGLDPVIEKIPFELNSVEKKIYKFYEDILNKCIVDNILPSAVKPNFAFYAQYGFEGLKALVDIIDLFKSNNVPVILDVKRGDIGSTAEAYAIEAFDIYKADAVTLSPYLGLDSIEPFINKKPDGGFYILVKTSNKSSGEIQDLICDDLPLYMKVAELLVKWNKPGLGAVVGATYSQELSRVVDFFESKGYNIPLLIPGIGKQGGDIVEVSKILKSSKSYKLHRINVSRSVNYAYMNYSGLKYDEAAIEELKKLVEFFSV